MGEIEMLHRPLARKTKWEGFKRQRGGCGGPGGNVYCLLLRWFLKRKGGARHTSLMLESAFMKTLIPASCLKWGWGSTGVSHTLCLWILVLSAKLLQLCPTLCNPMDCSLPGFSVHGILQAWILEWVAISFAREKTGLKDWTHVSYVSCTGRRVLYL